MKNKKGSMIMSHKLMRIVEVMLANNACELISSLNEISRSRTVSSNDRVILNDLISRKNKELIRNLRSIGFFDDNSRKSIFDKKGRKNENRKNKH